MKLEPTGERMIVEHYRSSPEDWVIYLLHAATYAFAEQFTRGKRVLDYGCGSGYGSARIARTADHVTGVDVADDAVAHAQSEFGTGNLDFMAIDPVEPLPFDDAAFDVVLSFQVFEHVSDTSLYLSEIRRVLSPQGRLVLVTPDRSTRLLPMQRPWNRWHVHEYGKGELRGLLGRYFENVEVLGMTGKPEMIGFELRRCRRVKWMMLPFTLPFIPDRLRVAALNAVHRIRRRSHTEHRDFPFTEKDVVIALNAAPSVNLVALAS